MRALILALINCFIFKTISFKCNVFQVINQLEKMISLNYLQWERGGEINKKNTGCVLNIIIVSTLVSIE